MGTVEALCTVCLQQINVAMHGKLVGKHKYPSLCVVWYGDSVDNIVEENSSIFSLI